MNIQLGTVFVFGVVVLLRYTYLFTNYGYSMVTYLEFAAAYGFIWFVSFVAFGILGFFQSLFVRWWVARGLGQLEPRTYLIQKTFTEVKEVLTNDDFLKTWDFKPEEGFQPHLVLQSRGISDTVLAAAPDSQDQKRTILTILGYAREFYQVRTDAEARRIVDDLTYSLKGRLDTLTFTQIEKDDITAPLALSFPTRLTQSRFEVTKGIWNTLPNYFKYAIVATLFTWLILVPIVYYYQSQLYVMFDFASFFTLEVLIFIALIAEIGLGAKDELKRIVKRGRGSNVRSY